MMSYSERVQKTRLNSIRSSSNNAHLCGIYHQISNMRRTISQSLNVSCLALQLSLPNPLKQCIKSRMKMWWEQRRQDMLQLHLNDQQFLCLVGCSYIRGFTVLIKHNAITRDLMSLILKTLTPRQNGLHFSGNIFKSIFLVNKDI